MTETPEQTRQRKFYEALLDYYVSWPRWRQVIALLLFMASCAISFQLIHGFDLLCNLTTKTGMQVCIATAPRRDTVGMAKRRDDNEAFRDTVLERLKPLPQMVADVKYLKTAINVIAEQTGNTNKVKKALHQESVFPEVSEMPPTFHPNRRHGSRGSMATVDPPHRRIP